MTTHDKDKIISAAKEAEIRKAFVCAIPDTCPDDDNCCHNRKPDGYWVKDEQLERFYAICFEAGRQAEREECLNICINHASDYAVFNCEPYKSMEQGALSCALTIRARSTK